MKFSVAREVLLRPLSMMAGVVGRRHTLPILSHIRIDATAEGLILTGLDLEVELIWRVGMQQLDVPGSITVPAKKLSDICRSLSDGAIIEFAVEDQRAVVRSGRSRFVLATLPSSEFPSIQLSQIRHQVGLPQNQLLNLIRRNDFAMARQDVRYYLNGMYFELQTGRLRAVATDGHRLSLADAQVQTAEVEKTSMIVPAKAINDLAKLLDDVEEPVQLIFGEQHFQVNTPHSTFISKQIEGRYPDYERVIPQGGDKLVLCDRLQLRQMLSRIGILANEKFLGIRLLLSVNTLTVVANNPEQEEAEESMTVQYQGESLEMGFNVGYLIDVMDNIGEQVEQVQLVLSDPASSALIQAAGGGAAIYVVMPMRL
ncbi:DNA polymerase III subunit beta [Marinospirillum alkaliphilum]|uniref:Beta sliding clamp n=1 Tax=Marinospirillum alkaliphilum DSM 21637 TaxID=1122209 RepID=A0A1K1WRT1_9GAMM|nr:DNA polymerase III subunit beta [Marinospirillum alkaliphilum]SFX39835.1 DNA polymerase III, beta subunit [Marinospirillum alkaliphilum DSM 21637]